MENASKALIIAGAILISIVIITLGVMIVNNVTGLISSSSDMTQQEIQTFNAKFQSYEGPKVTGANVKALINAINSNNNTTDESWQVSLTGSIKTTTAVKTGYRYTVTFTTDTTGRISECAIEQVGAQQQGGGN